MIKSKYDTSWLSFLTFMLGWCFLLFVVGSSQFFFHYKILGMGMLVDKTALFLVLIGITGLFFFFFFLWHEANIIFIDTTNKTIAFKNILTRQTDKFSFDDFSGYVDTLQRIRRRNYKVLYIVQNKKYAKKISAAMYRNFDELLIGLNSATYLGFVKSGFRKRLQILFNNAIHE